MIDVMLAGRWGLYHRQRIRFLHTLEQPLLAVLEADAKLSFFLAEINRFNNLGLNHKFFHNSRPIAVCPHRTGKIAKIGSINMMNQTQPYCLVLRHGCAAISEARDQRFLRLVKRELTKLAG
jgi:hypothetical protein